MNREIVFNSGKWVVSLHLVWTRPSHTHHPPIKDSVYYLGICGFASQSTGWVLPEVGADYLALTSFIFSVILLSVFVCVVAL